MSTYHDDAIAADHAQRREACLVRVYQTAMRAQVARLNRWIANFHPHADSKDITQYWHERIDRVKTWVGARYLYRMCAAHQDALEQHTVNAL